MSDRIFVDPDRGEKWRVSKEGYAGVPYYLMFKNEEAVRLWAGEAPTREVDAISDEDLRKAWRASWREFWHEEGRWCVRCEERDLQTWTWFESASWEKRVVKAQIMFPFLTGRQLVDALSKAKRFDK